MNVNIQIPQLDEIINRLTALEQAVKETSRTDTKTSAPAKEPETKAPAKPKAKRPRKKAEAAPKAATADPAPEPAADGNGKAESIPFDTLATAVKAHAAKVGIEPVRDVLKSLGAGKLSELDAAGQTALIAELGLTL